MHLPYSDWGDAQAQFKRHVNAISGIHSESVKKYSSFLNEMAGKVILANVQVVQVNKPRRTTVFYCQSPTFLKLPGERTFL